MRRIMSWRIFGLILVLYIEEREFGVVVFYCEVWTESRGSRFPTFIMPKTSGGKQNYRQALRLLDLFSSLRLRQITSQLDFNQVMNGVNV